jgi:hypothetical protein
MVFSFLHQLPQPASVFDFGHSTRDFPGAAILTAKDWLVLGERELVRKIITPGQTRNVKPGVRISYEIGYRSSY